jgi:hypothetical protein
MTTEFGFIDYLVLLLMQYDLRRWTLGSREKRRSKKMQRLFS